MDNSKRRLESKRRRRAVAKLMAQGVFIRRELARRIGISRSAVQRYVESIEAEWGAQTKNFAARAFMRQLVSLQQRRQELLAAWERSQKAAETSTTKTTAGGTETTHTVKGQVGDVSFIRELRGIDAHEAALLGLLKEPAGKDEPEGPDLSRMPKDQLLAIAEEIQGRIAARAAGDESGDAGATP